MEPTDELRLLAVGDVHLGTRPSRLPEDLESAGIDPRDLTPEAALESSVDWAIHEGVDAVLFAGDVVESANARYEALRPLEAAVRRLHDASIPVVAVVGNHDVEALPRLSQIIDGLEILGEKGRWQARLIENGRGGAVEVVGWSFPEREVRESPVAGLLRNPIAPSRPGVPRIGLLHGDLDASGGAYAPVSRADLTAVGLDAWLLGHIHKPSLAERMDAKEPAPLGYLGSLVGLDPGEMGPHGPWLVHVTQMGEVFTRPIPMAPLRWERVDVHVGLDDGPDDVGDRILSEATRRTREIHASGSVPKVLGLRPRLVGATRHDEALRRQIASGLWERALSRSVGETFFFVDRIIDGLDLVQDLDALARGDDPPALLARKLLILDRPGPERAELIESTRRELAEVATDARWSELDDPARRDREDPLSDGAIVDWLRRSGRAALARLLAQPEHASGSDR